MKELQNVSSKNVVPMKETIGHQTLDMTIIYQNKYFSFRGVDEKTLLKPAIKYQCHQLV